MAKMTPEWIDGWSGLVGAPGATGVVGPKGDTGLLGVTGTPGSTGPSGLIGPQGARGLQGLQGERGATGVIGPQGWRGDPGPQGIQGDTGVQGPQGIQGDTGVPGSTGPAGAGGGSVCTKGDQLFGDGTVGAPLGVSGAVKTSGDTMEGHLLVQGALLGSNGLTGTAGQVLTKQANGTQLWAAPSGGGGGYSVVNVSGMAGYTAVHSSGTVVLECDSTNTGTTVYLPTVVDNTAMFVVKKTSASNTIAIWGYTGAGATGQHIDGYPTTTVTGLYESKTLVTNGINWLVI